MNSAPFPDNAKASHEPSIDATGLREQNASLVADNAALRAKLQSTQQHLDSLKKLLFGPSSEKRPFDIPGQSDLFGRQDKETDTKAPKKPVAGYDRGRAKKAFPEGCVNEDGLRFDDSVPVKHIELAPEGIEGLSPDEYEIIGTKKRYKLAQQAASYTVLCYEQPVIKLKDTQVILPLVPVPSILDRSLADVSLFAGVLVDKFVSHLPLYRQHQRLEAAGIHLARSTLTNLAKTAIELLVPIYDAQWHNVLHSQVLAMDETPIKAGKSKNSKKKGRMNQGYFWPIFGEQNEIVFTYADSRARYQIEKILAQQFSGTLLTDGYGAYAAFCKANENVIHAQCWSHGRRKFVDAHESEPALVDEALELIGRLYKVEKDIREEQLDREAKLARRQSHSAPIVKKIFDFITEQRADPSHLPKSKFAKALQYLDNRRAELQVFLDNPDVPIDTNHLERDLRCTAMGRRAWLYCWTELGAEHVGVIQSLLSTCKLHGVDPYTYLVDVLQRVGEHPAKDVIQLTPREWKVHFADDPLKSPLAQSG